MPNAANANVSSMFAHVGEKASHQGSFNNRFYIRPLVAPTVTGTACIDDNICPFLQHHIALPTSCGNRYAWQCGHWHFGTLSSLCRLGICGWTGSCAVKGCSQWRSFPKTNTTIILDSCKRKRRGSENHLSYLGDARFDRTFEFRRVWNCRLRVFFPWDDLRLA